MPFDPQVRARWKARSERLRAAGHRVPTRLEDRPETEKLDRSTDEPRPILFGHIVPLRNTIHARIVSRAEVNRRLWKLCRM
jgi:hypothetical protein